jgi:NAD(P)H-dependent flavin oxidoreductase YrpB (nitropropane dioxygenase family)
MRAIRTCYTDEWEARKHELQAFPMQAARATQDGVWHIGSGLDAGFDPDRDCMPTGQSAGGIATVKPCRDIIGDIVAQAATILNRLPRPSAA